MSPPSPEERDPYLQQQSLVAIPRPKRWDQPFSRDMSERDLSTGDMSDEDIDRVLKTKPFSDIDQGRFPRKASLRDILRNDTRIRKFKNGEIVVRQGDYGTSAFFILHGTVIVVLNPSLPERDLGRRQSQRKTMLGALLQLAKKRGVPEFRDLRKYPGASSGQPVSAEEHDDRIILSDIPTILTRHKTVRMSVYEGQMEEGQLFGELGAIGRVPRAATVFAEGEPELLELRWQGLRDIMKATPALREYIEATFRERTLKVALQTMELFDRKHLRDEALETVAEESTLETYGQLDWYGPYRKIAKMEAAERLEAEPTIAAQGHYINGVVCVLAGFARLSQRHGNAERTVSYLGAGQLFGFEEAYHNWREHKGPVSRHNRPVPLQTTLRAVGYVTVLLVPTAVLERYIFPVLPTRLRPAAIVPKGDPLLSATPVPQSPNIATDMLEFMVDTRVINGTATMMIDLDRCTRCDDCVRACADTHDGNPRFVRHGQRSGHYMIANACMHCADPVCMIGCPTGAIHRVTEGGQVVINDLTCIGCQLCAVNCPYDNIRMVDIRDKNGMPILDEATYKPIQKATKCDLCTDQPGGPACQRACPHDALVRIDTSKPDALAAWLHR